MNIEVRVMPRSSREEVVKVGEDSYKVYMHEAAVEGKANKKLIEMIANYLSIKKSNIGITRGIKSKNKLIKIII